ncbi:hypothetical protein [Paenarthrobacter sp. NPDC018779]|uniref:hypothetical protein n=1 Tax=Paenarthrobacter sp. NPDC018779 TaxID=3364375 RepID=UPI0037C875AB
MGIGGGVEAAEVADAGSVATSGVAGLLLDAKSVTEKIPGTPEHLRPETSAPSKQAFSEPLEGSLGGLGASLSDALDDGAAALETLRDTALPTARLFDFQEAADFAGRVEELARSIEYLQIVAAQAVERTREEAKHARTVPALGGTTGWRTGWTEDDAPAGTSPLTAGPYTTSNTNSSGSTGADAGSGAGTGVGTGPGAGGVGAGAGTDVAGVPAQGSVLDDGYRNAAEFLRARLRIEIREARRRLSQAAALLPTTTLTELVNTFVYEGSGFSPSRVRCVRGM